MDDVNSDNKVFLIDFKVYLQGYDERKVFTNFIDSLVLSTNW